MLINNKDLTTYFYARSPVMVTDHSQEEEENENKTYFDENKKDHLKSIMEPESSDESINARNMNPFDDNFTTAYPASDKTLNNVGSLIDKSMNLKFLKPFDENSQNIINYPKKAVIDDIKLQKLQEPSVYWLRFLFSGNTLSFINCIRGFVFLPLLIGLLILCLLSNHWQYISYSYQNMDNYFTFGLRSFTEKTNTIDDNNLSVVYEKKIFYNDIINEPQIANLSPCNIEFATNIAMKTLGNDMTLDLHQTRTNREYKKALFTLLYEPLFKDLTCQSIVKLSQTGYYIQVLIVVTIILTLIEWSVILLHVFNKTRLDEAKLAYSYACGIPYFGNFSPEKEIKYYTYDNDFFKLYMVSKYQIRLPQELNKSLRICSSNAILDCAFPDETKSENTTPRFTSYPTQNTEKSAEHYKVVKTFKKAQKSTKIHLEKITPSYRVTIEKLWWVPINKILQAFNIQLTQGNLNHYFFVSILEGVTTIFSTFSMAVAISTFFLTLKMSKETKIIDKMVQISHPNLGLAFYLFLFTSILYIINFTSHLFSPKIIRYVDIKLNSKNIKNSNTCQMNL